MSGLPDRNEHNGYPRPSRTNRPGVRGLCPQNPDNWICSSADQWRQTKSNTLTIGKRVQLHNQYPVALQWHRLQSTVRQLCQWKA
eukprot:992574-Amphidinium_carterae.1